MSSLSSIPRKLGSFGQLPWREKLGVLEAWLCLHAAWVALRTIGLKRSMAAIGWMTAGKKRTVSLTIMEAHSLTRLVRIASRNSLALSNCLRTSLALWWLLRRRGAAAELRIGVQKENGQLLAHAWVELGGAILNDTPDVAQRYAPFPQIMTERGPLVWYSAEGDG